MPQRSPQVELSSSHSLVRSDEDDPCGLLSQAIMGSKLSTGMEKLPPLAIYDGSMDPEDHNKNIDAMLDYRNVRGAVKGKLFPTTLWKGTMTWYKNLASKSIHFWRDLKTKFTRNFTASRRHPKTDASLESIVQGSNEPVLAYLERFTQEAIQVRTNDYMKGYLLEKGLLLGSDFRKVVAIETPCSLDEFLLKAQSVFSTRRKVLPTVPVIRGIGKAPEVQNTMAPHHLDELRRKEERINLATLVSTRGLFGRFTEYTLHTAPRERILSECTNSEFKECRVRFPKAISSKPEVDKTNTAGTTGATTTSPKTTSTSRMRSSPRLGKVN